MVVCFVGQTVWTLERLKRVTTPTAQIIVREMIVMCVPISLYRLMHSSTNRNAVICLKNCRYGVKPYALVNQSINQSINQSRIREIISAFLKNVKN